MLILVNFLIFIDNFYKNILNFCKFFLTCFEFFCKTFLKFFRTFSCAAYGSGLLKILGYGPPMPTGPPVLGVASPPK